MGKAESKTKAGAAADDVGALVGEITDLAGDLARQQLSLLAAEVRQKVSEAGGAAAALAAGAGLLAAGGALSTVAVVHLLHESTRLPLWACYGLVAGVAGAAGLELLADARARAAAVRSPALPETTEALRENFTWLKEQLSTAVS